MNALELIEAIAEQAGVYVEVRGDSEIESTLRDMEVRIAQQPSWPFEYNIGQVVGPDEITMRHREEEECPEHDGYLIGHAGCDVELAEEDTPKVIYIGEAGQIGYLPGMVKDALGWGR
jgi:hypothetical protein